MGKLFDYKTVTYESTKFKDCNDFEPELNAEGIPFENEDIGELFTVPKRWTLSNGFEIDKTFRDEETFATNYGNLLYSVAMRRKLVSVSRNGDKVSIKLYIYGRRRLVGRRYFKVTTDVRFLTYNIAKNALYFGQIFNYHKKRNVVKKVRRVLLTQDWINDIMLNIYQLFHDDPNRDTMIDTVVSKFFGEIPGVEKYKDEEPKFKFYKHFLETAGNKLPNNWKSFLFIHQQPRKPELIKNEYKYVDTFMSINKLSGDKIKRCLHSVSEINLESLSYAFGIFGLEYVISKSDEDIKKIIESKNVAHYPFTDLRLDTFTKTEINKVYEIYKLVVDCHLDSQTFMDHISFKIRLQDTQPVKWKSTTYDDFNTEHYDWSEKVGSLTKTTYLRKYDKDFKEWVEDTIPVGVTDYYPRLLTSSPEYNYESMTQNNCVRTYVNNPRAVIFSLIKDSPDSFEKLTVEYVIRGEYNSDDQTLTEVTLRRVQTKYKSNQTPSNEWDEVLKKLDDKINLLCKQKIFTLPEIEVMFPNKTKIDSRLVMSDDGDVWWDNRGVRDLPSWNFTPEFYAVNDDDLPL